MLTSLPILIIEAHSRCNCRCEMCDIWQSTDARTVSVTQLGQQLDSIDQLGTRQVVFTGGEPLMNPEFFDLCRPLRERDIRITLLSTGLLLARYASRIVECVDDVIVSLDGPPDLHDAIRRTPDAFEMLARGVSALHGFPVTARCVVQRRNHHALLATAEVAAALGLRSISYLAADVTSSAFHRREPWSILRQNEIALTEDQLPLLAEQLQLLSSHPLIADSPEHLSRILLRFRAHLGLEPPVAPPCNAPWVSAYLRADGAVQPCFFHNSVGSTANASLLNVLNTPSATGFRDHLDVSTNPTCRNCVCSLHLR